MGENKNSRDTAAQFYVAGELCRRDLVAVATLGKPLIKKTTIRTLNTHLKIRF